LGAKLSLRLPVDKRPHYGRDPDAQERFHPVGQAMGFGHGQVGTSQTVEGNSSNTRIISAPC
jgi:hypothetical protein